MIIYNVTVNIDSSVHDEWLKWMKEVHIPHVMRTGCFTENKMCRILVDEQQGISYSIQYSAPDMAAYEKYRTQFAPAMQKEHTERYKDKFVAFRTLLQVV